MRPRCGLRDRRSHAATETRPRLDVRPSFSGTYATAIGLVLLVPVLACTATPPAPYPSTDANRQTERDAMVAHQLIARGITAEHVLNAMRHVPRHRFVPARYASMAYDDAPVPIGFRQTASQPFIIAYMLEALELHADDRVLEIGTGSGYQTALLAEIAQRVFTIEIVPSLAEGAAQALRDLGYTNVTTRVGDGSVGWPDEAPFDAIIVGAAAEQVPPLLLPQLAEGGRMVIPIGPDEDQRLVLYRRTADRIESTALAPVAFVPLIEGGKER